LAPITRHYSKQALQVIEIQSAEKSTLRGNSTVIL